MPPKIKITKEEIVDTALNLVREAGEQALNARSIAAKLKCSTQRFFLTLKLWRIYIML